MVSGDSCGLSAFATLPTRDEGFNLHPRQSETVPIQALPSLSLLLFCG